MGKRSTFERRERDFYPTPYAAVVPLLPHLCAVKRYEEPCAGDGALISHLAKHGKICARASDIAPQSVSIKSGDATTQLSCNGDCFITNPPWSRPVLHKIIERLSDIAPAWLLFDADWMHTKQSAALMDRCRKIVSVGRLRWIPDSKMTGKDNCAWYLFDNSCLRPTQFVGRSAPTGTALNKMCLIKRKRKK